LGICALAGCGDDDASPRDAAAEDAAEEASSETADVGEEDVESSHDADASTLAERADAILAAARCRRCRTSRLSAR
jgi:hypothetical protein